MLNGLSNRRRFARVRPRSDAPVEVQLLGKVSAQTGVVDAAPTSTQPRQRCVDVSAGGIAIRVTEGFSACRIGDVIQLLVLLPTKSSFAASAEIRHIADLADESVFGVEFVMLRDQHRLQLTTYVDEMLAYGTFL